MADKGGPYGPRKWIGAVVLVAVLGAGVYYGMHVPHSRTVLQAAVAPPPRDSDSPAVLTVRENSPMPTCGSRLAIETVQGQLARVEKDRVVGLSNVAETGRTARNGHACEATVTLASGARTVSYTIDNDASGRNGWQMEIRR